MSTATSEYPEVDQDSEQGLERAAGNDGGDDIEARGQVRIADRVVQKIATRVIDAEVPYATLTRTGLARAPGRMGTLLGSSSVSAHVDGELVTLEATISVEWPQPVREVAAQVRDQLSRRLDELCGLNLAQADLVVSSLPAPETEDLRAR